jgi:hypothetical protein
VTQAFDGDDGEFGLDDGCDLFGHVEHLVVVGDQAVPTGLVKGDDQRSVVQIGQAAVDDLQVGDLHVGRQEVVHGVDQWDGEVLIQRHILDTDAVTQRPVIQPVATLREPVGPHE